MTTMSDDDLASIEIRSGVNEHGKGFCHVMARAEGGRILMGQVDPATVRTMALDWLGAAEAAETDAIIYGLLTEKFGLDLDIVGHFIADMRDARNE